MYVKQTSRNPTALRLESEVSDGQIILQIVCPDTTDCVSGLDCQYKKGPVERKYDEGRFPVGDDIVTPLGCGNVLTIVRDEQGFYIERDATRHV